MAERNQMIINFNDNSYNVNFNDQSGYYELELTAPINGGIYNAEIHFTDLLLKEHTSNQPIQIFLKEPIILEMNKVFMWIFDGMDFKVKDIVELSNYEINIDEETNASSLINVLKKTTAKEEDIVAIKKNNEVVYWGTVENIQNENGEMLYEYTLKYFTNIFDQDIILKNENLIKTTGVEDFIADAINTNFVKNTDTFVNKTFLEVVVKTHTKKQVSVSNVENGIYNLHTWMTNCTQNYGITYTLSIINKKLRLTLENKEIKKELVDTIAQSISNYSEVFETNIVSKVVVLTSTDTYTLYLLNDRTTTTDMTNKNRAKGKTVTIYTENYEDARQTALDEIKANSYNHNITFDYYNRTILVGTPIAIKTKESIIYDTYISAIKITPEKMTEHTCGNIRTKFIDKLLKERKK
ncbi:MAG TPA: hypothetical protein H9829_01450 [Candidatus Tetragenococcus pullicola]|nr:hypothetical protein [Candidatus Tetragenococcus pullicola]